MKTHKMIVIAMMVAGLMVSNVRAALMIVDPIDPRTSPVLSSWASPPYSGSDYYSYQGIFDPYMVTDGSGLNGANVNIYPTGTPVPGSWATMSSSVVIDGQFNIWLNQTSPSGSVVLHTPPAFQTTSTDIYFDLGQQYDVAGFHLWNYNGAGATGRGVSNTAVYVSLNASSWTFKGNYDLAEASGLNTYQGEDYTLSGTFRYVVFANAVPWAGFSTTDFAPGLSEIRFEVYTPEPSTVMLLGVGAAMLVWRRRSRRTE